jgi:adenine-specific DNA-methyltransferase
MRHYGDGLEKFEPNDLNHALAPSQSWFSKLPADIVNSAIEYCRINNSLPEEVEALFEPLALCAEQGAAPDRYSAALHSSR